MTSSMPVLQAHAIEQSRERVVMNDLRQALLVVDQRALGVLARGHVTQNEADHFAAIDRSAGSPTLRHRARCRRGCATCRAWSDIVAAYSSG